MWKAITVNRMGNCVITAAAAREVFGQSPHHPMELCNTLDPCRDGANMELENQTSSSSSWEANIAYAHSQMHRKNIY